MSFPQGRRRRLLRTWAPRVWLGCSISSWWALLRRHRFAVGPHHLHTVVVDSFASIANSVLARAEHVVFARRLRGARPTAHPLFVIGHWRSGTTLLHELLCLDPRHASPTMYQVFAAHHFLLTEPAFAGVFGLLVPSHRPMDRMAWTLRSPFEDEFALCLLGARSPYENLAFPNAVPFPLDLLDPRNLPPDEQRQWRQTLVTLIARLTVRYPGKRMVLKSPPHTCRIRTLLELFPGARFVHIVRNPHDVFLSTQRLWHVLHRTQGLQNPRTAPSDEQVISTLLHLHGCVARDRALIPPRQFHELRYEDLIAEPVEQMRRLYERLDLGEFHQVRSSIESEMAARSAYRTNRYDPTPDERGMVGRRLGAVLRQYGYAADDREGRHAPA